MPPAVQFDCDTWLQPPAAASQQSPKHCAVCTHSIPGENWFPLQPRPAQAAWHRAVSSASRQANRAGAVHAVHTQQPGSAWAAGAENEATAAIDMQSISARR